MFWTINTICETCIHRCRDEKGGGGVGNVDVIAGCSVFGPSYSWCAYIEGQLFNIHPISHRTKSLRSNSFGKHPRYKKHMRLCTSCGDVTRSSLHAFPLYGHTRKNVLGMALLCDCRGKKVDDELVAHCNNNVRICDYVNALEGMK